MAQDSLPVKFAYSQKRINDSIVTVAIKATPRQGIKLFAIQKNGEEGFFSTTDFDSSITKKLRGGITETGNIQSSGARKEMDHWPNHT